ncbi:MAG TPA: isopentenyl-diphosphate Delta-isomerase [Puia sp.]|jgi:isopentenyl-diphosphate delta-isomerase
MEEEVILVNEQDEQTGTIEKMEAHRKALLHRAFSIFIFNGKGEMLLQQRAAAKYHSPGLWTNACCSHPRPGEPVDRAAQRRLKEEMGFETELKKIFDFIYKVNFDNGLTEFEFDHVYAGHYGGRGLNPDKQEVLDYCFRSVEDIQHDLDSCPEKYSTWFRIAFPRVKDWLESDPSYSIH